MLLFQNISWGFDQWCLQNGLGRCQNGWFVAKKKDHRRNDDRKIFITRGELKGLGNGYNNVIWSKC